jgi:hypothetical protein
VSGRRAAIIRSVSTILATAVASGAVVLAAQSGLVNARVDTRSAATGLEPAVRAVLEGKTTSWVGYRVPMTRPTKAPMSQAEWCCGRCRLEPPAELTVLARVEAGAVVALRSMAVDCDVDAGGMPVVWLTDVKPDDSVAWLASLVAPDSANTGKRPAPLTRSALAAIGQHDTRSAVPALVNLARQNTNRAVRGEAMFWLGRSSDPRALEFLEQTLLK